MQFTQSPDFLARLAEAAQTIPGGGFAFTAILFILVLSVLIFVHELGHYLAARSVGIRVEVFSIGFGRALLSWTDQANTRWKIGWLPLGGYVQMLGQTDGKAYSHANNPASFAAKSVAQRAWVIIAGPLANLLFGFLLLIIVMLSGEHKLKAEVGTVLPNMPAAGVLQPRDLITAINGQPIVNWESFQETVSAAVTATGGVPLQVTVQRQGQPVTLPITPKVTTFTDLLGDTHTVGRLGVAPTYATFVTYYPPLQAVPRAAERTWEITSLTVRSLYKLLIGAVSAENLTGPLGIANLTGQTASSGLFALLMFMVVITINLCIVNLFPLPVLDGGHLVFLAYEKIRGRPVGELAQEWLFRGGLACIIMLALFSTFNDVKRLIAPAAVATPAAPAGSP